MFGETGTKMFTENNIIIIKPKNDKTHKINLLDCVMYISL